jgi:hypothetical protein
MSHESSSWQLLPQFQVNVFTDRLSVTRLILTIQRNAESAIHIAGTGFARTVPGDCYRPLIRNRFSLPVHFGTFGFMVWHLACVSSSTLGAKLPSIGPSLLPGKVATAFHLAITLAMPIRHSKSNSTLGTHALRGRSAEVL